MRRFFVCFGTIVAACVSLAVSRAAADVPEATYIFPAGAQRGTTVDVRIGGLHLHDACPIEFDASDVTAPKAIQRTQTIRFEGPLLPQPDSQRAEDYPNDYAAQLKIAADAPPGVRWWRLSTSQGVTPSQAFVVGDLPEIVEQEIEGATIAVAVETPVTVNGRIYPREDVDEWSFRGVKGRTVRCEVTAARIGSPLDSQIEILDAAGRRLAFNSDHFGADSLVLFTPPADGEYRIRIFDAAFGGLQTHVYRLTLSELPHVAAVYPLGGRRGSTTEFELAGLGVDGLKQSLVLPKDATDEHFATFKIAGKPTNTVPLDVSDFEERLEAEPNDDVEHAAALAVPSVANGRIGRAGDVDFWAVEAKAKDVIQFEVRAARLGSPVDSVVTVVDAAGLPIGTNDDLTTSEADSFVRFTAPEDGRYYLRVEDRSPNRGGAAFAYRVVAQPAGAGDFRLALTTDAASLNRNGTFKFDKLLITRLGFAGDIFLKIDGLPPGVTFTPEKIGNGRPEVTLQFKADDGLPIALHRCTVRGTAKIGDAEVSRTATVDVRPDEPPLETLRLMVAMPTPFVYSGSLTLPYAQRGTFFTRHFEIERNGFEGPIEVRLAERQMRHLQGVKGKSIVVPAGENEFDYTIYLPTFLEMGRTSRTVMTLLGEVVDEQGRKHKVSYTSGDPQRQIALIIGPGPLTIDADPATLAPTAEQPSDVQIQLDRDAAVTGPVRIELLVPPHMRGVSAEPIVVAAGETAGTLRLRFAADAGPFNFPLTLRAVHGEGLNQVVAETALEIVE
jgi:hypothetical protein